MFLKILGMLKILSHGADTGKISTTKIWMWITGTSMSIIEFQGQIASAGVTIPPEFMPVFKMAALIGGVVTIIKLRDKKAADQK